MIDNTLLVVSRNGKPRTRNSRKETRMSLVVVGTVAFDSIETPHGAANDALGGSASYFSYVASFFTTPRLVAVVGEDSPDEHRQMFKGRRIDTAGLVPAPGKTFR